MTFVLRSEVHKGVMGMVTGKVLQAEGAADRKVTFLNISFHICLMELITVSAGL